ncbi:MAG: FG-GAP repeat protein [Candidatus Thermoplasmatota archaeon]|nr:FG-GAP repeat protein [Candidatus Thermoplasmatota archaeon]
MRRIVAVLVAPFFIASAMTFMDFTIETMGMNGPSTRNDDLTMDMNISEASLASFIGEAAGYRSGNSVSGVGDVNGDGFNDFIIGAFCDDEAGHQAGQTYLIFGKASGWTMDMNLSNADASFLGEGGDTGDNSGYYVSGAGDVNGDGNDDILIGANCNDDNGNCAGQTYLIFGKKSGWSMDTPLSGSDASFLGESSSDLSPRSLSAAGDVNGDGYDDILIGVSGNGPSGQVYLIFGKASGWSMDKDLGSVDASFIGEENGDSLGVSVSGAGDVNGDGYNDILIGASGNDEGGSDAGQTYLYLGRSTSWSMDMDLSSADASFIGEAAGDESGYSVSGAGDVNGDGYDDLLIGAYKKDGEGIDRGQTFLIFGKASGWAMDTDLSRSDASFIGERDDDCSGSPVSQAGDVNGDGYDDILIASRNNYESGNNRGQIYLIYGKSSEWNRDMNLSNVDASFWGQKSDIRVGSSISSVGDVNGDGTDDFLIGSENNNEKGNSAGQTYLISGYSYSEPLDVYSVDLYSDIGFSTPTTISDIGDTLYIEVKGLDSNASNIDTAVVNVTSRPGSFGLMRVGCKETGLNTGTYRGIFKVPPKTLYLDTLKFYSRKDPTKFDTLFIDHPFRPTSINSLGTYYDDQYSIEVDKVELGETIYIEVIGQDANSISRNIALVNISTEYSVPVPYPLVLQETDINTGIYRTEFQVPENFIWLENIRLASCRDPRFNSNVKVDIPFRPLSISSLKVRSDSSYSKEIDKVQLNETLYIEVVGQDANELTQNSAFVNISSETDPTPLVMRFNETDLNTGVYRGWFRIPNSTRMLENLTISSAEDPSKTAKVMVCILVEIGPKDPIRITNEDELYRVQYSNLGYADDPTWTYTIKCDWLTFDVDTLVLSGTPDNEDVGTVSVSFTLSDDIGHFDVQEFVLTVNNVFPIILTEPVTEVKEGEQYKCDFDSTDDGQGSIKWTLIGANTWMSIDEISGWLTGTPTNEEVGVHNLSVIVNDGNGGVNSTSFQLTVIDLNMPPVILSMDIKTGKEGEKYYRDYEAHDPDNTEDFIWELTTDANFLTIDVQKGIVEGTPGPFDVGDWSVNVTVKDLGGLMDSHIFTLHIEDVDSKPVWIDVPPNVNIKHGQFYSFDANASDPDINSFIIYSIESKPVSDIQIDQETGIIKWTASIHWFTQEPYNLKVTIKVSDGLNFNLHTFTITVIASEPPASTIIGPLNGERTSSRVITLQWEGTDPEDDSLTYDIYLHETEAFVAGMREEALYIEELAATKLNVSELDPGKTYYWSVLPNDGCTFGTCTSGILSFRVNYCPTFKHVDDHEVPAGTSFKLKVSCTDQDPEDIQNLRFSLLEAPNGMSISEETGMIRWTPKDNQVMLHSVIVQVTDGIDTNSLTFEIEVTKGETSTSTLLITVAIVVVVIILLAFGIFFFLRKKKQMDEEALKRGEEERAALEKEREQEYLSYEQLYGVPAPSGEEAEDDITTEELKEAIHEQIEKLQQMGPSEE